MKVLVTGGAGFIGRHLCTELVARDHGVTAFSRDPDADVLPDGVDTAVGDVTDYDTLPDVVGAHDAVIHLVSLSPLFQPKGGKGRHEDVTVAGTRNVVRAMETSGVKRLIYQSGLGVDPEGSTAYLRAKGRAEGIVKASDLDWTITRPSVIFGDGEEFVPFVRTLTTPYVTVLPGGGRTGFQPIWVGDFVELLAEILEDDDHIGETYEFGGPDELTLADVTRIVYGTTGRRVHILPLPMPVARLGLTLAGVVPFVPFGVDQYHGLQLENRTDQNAISRFGRAPDDLVTLEEYLDADIPSK